MTAEQKSKLAQGVFFGLFFLYLGYFTKSCAGEYGTVKAAGKFAMVMGLVMVGWGLRQARARCK